MFSGDNKQVGLLPRILLQDGGVDLMLNQMMEICSPFLRIMMWLQAQEGSCQNYFDEDQKRQHLMVETAIVVDVGGHCQRNI